MTRLSLGAWVCAVAACAMMLAVIAWGQTGTASIYLEVVDPKGLAVVGAKVTLTSADTKASRTEVTDSTGIFLFPALAPGQYSVRVENAGFRSYVQGVELFVNTTHKIKAQLEVGAVTETIRVTEVGVVLNTTDATMGNVITPQQVASLPLEARSPVALLTLQPRVVFSGDPNDNRSGAVNGARSDQVNVTLDGVDANDQQKDINLTTAPFSTAFTPGLQIPLESIQEFRITTSNPNADQGRSSGGQIGFVTKSGTNDFFNNLATPRVPVPKLIRNQFGGSAGGPILRQRFFFFAAYEGNRRREESNELRIIPTDSLRQGFVKYTDSGGNVVTLAPADIKT